jgi:hypothetical protein
MKHLFVALILSAIVMPAMAEETPKQHCDRVVAEAEKGPKQMVAAGNLYRHGSWNGVKCVKVDYARAFELYVKGGDRNAANGLLKDLERKANAGMEGARIAIRRLEARGYIWVDIEQVR